MVVAVDDVSDRDPEPVGKFLLEPHGEVGVDRVRQNYAVGRDKEDGGELYVATTDWQTTAEVWRIRAARPVLSSSPAVRIPKGPAQLDLRGAPQNAVVWLVLTTSPPTSPETALLHDLGVPLWVGLNLAKPHLVLLAKTDAAGSYQLKHQNPGGTGFRVHLQALAVVGTTPATRQVGTSNVLSINIQP